MPWTSLKLSSHFFEYSLILQNFTANVNPTDVVLIKLTEAITSRYLRVIPTDWHGRPALRMEILAFVNDTEIGKRVNDLD